MKSSLISARAPTPSIRGGCLHRGSTFWTLCCLSLLLAMPACVTHQGYRTMKKYGMGEHLKYVNEHPLGTYIPINERNRDAATQAAARALSTKREKEPLEKYTADRFWLGHVEVTDYGVYKDEQQMELIETAVKEDAATGGGMFKKGITVVVFIHGWHNNAQEDNGNLNHFRDLLHDVAKKENNPEGRGVLGVYLSWRGASLKGPLKYITYWDRGRAADMVGRGITVEALSRIRNIYAFVGGKDQSSASLQKVYRNSRLVLIGHSFGGRALYSAVGQGMETNFLQPYFYARSYPNAPEASRPETTMPLVTGFGDLVMLINPAMHSLPYRKMHYAMYSNQKVNYDGKQPVLMMTLSSQGDTPNKSYLRIGELLGNRLSDVPWLLKEDNKEPRQNITAMGHYKPYHSHKLELIDGKPHLSMEPGYLNARQKVNFKTLETSGDFQSLNADKMDPQLLPFMVVSVDNRIIHGHSGFWPKEGNAYAYDFVKDFIAKQNKNVSNARKENAPQAVLRLTAQ